MTIGIFSSPDRFWHMIRKHGRSDAGPIVAMPYRRSRLCVDSFSHSSFVECIRSRSFLASHTMDGTFATRKSC
jgi:hypothetical protein